MDGSGGAREVAEMLALTLEREDASGAPWCPPRDAAALRRWVTDRSAQFGTGIRRAVRLVRLMALADGRDPVRFLYARLTSLRAHLFRHALESAAAQGRLPKAVAMLSQNGVLLQEPALSAEGGEAFEIDFAQMPRLAALVDFLHNALGFCAVADLVAPLLQSPAPAGTANEVARKLHAAANAWLGERLASGNHIRQARHIRGFLAGRSALAPEAIDDETILTFWIATATEPVEEAVDGFRLFRSAAAAMLRYRQALRDAVVERRLESSLREGLPPEQENLIDRARDIDESWQSPVAALARGSASRVKWLTRKEQQLLLNYLGAALDGDEDDGDMDDEENASGWEGGLAGDERFDLAFRLTLLRADVFGATQASIVARLRKRAPPEQAISLAVDAVDDQAYTACAASYDEVRAQLRLECLAALAMLMETGTAEAVILLDHFAGRAAVTAVLGSLTGGGSETDGIGTAARSQIASALRRVIADPDQLPGEAGSVLRQAQAAARRVSRAGFRREDRAEAAMLEGVACGAPAAVAIMGELDRLAAALSAETFSPDLRGDRARFVTALRRIYAADRG
jgi:hypothetical protein